MLETEVIGARLKARREQKELTIKQVAERAGLSIGFISQVERCMTDPSLASLNKMAAALDMEMSELFEKEAEVVGVVRKGQGAKLNLPTSVVCEMLAPTFNKQMDPTLKHIKPHSESGALEPHKGEEFVFVLKGTIVVEVGDVKHCLNEGDSIYFQSASWHGWKNVSSEACDVLWIVTPPHQSPHLD